MRSRIAWINGRGQDGITRFIHLVSILMGVYRHVHSGRQWQLQRCSLVISMSFSIRLTITMRTAPCSDICKISIRIDWDSQGGFIEERVDRYGDVKQLMSVDRRNKESLTINYHSDTRLDTL